MLMICYQTKAKKSIKFLPSPVQNWRKLNRLAIADLAGLVSRSIGNVWRYDFFQTLRLLEAGDVSPSNLAQVLIWALEGLAPGLLERQYKWFQELPGASNTNHKIRKKFTFSAGAHLPGQHERRVPA